MTAGSFSRRLSKLIIFRLSLHLRFRSSRNRAYKCELSLTSEARSFRVPPVFRCGGMRRSLGFALRTNELHPLIDLGSDRPRVALCRPRRLNPWALPFLTPCGTHLSARCCVRLLPPFQL